MSSSVLAGLGFDPLPYYREAATPNAEFPLSSFVGLPDDEYFRTQGRNVPELRKRVQDPTFLVSPDQAAELGIADGAWARVKTAAGSMLGRVFSRSSMPKGLVRIPHGWWKPESSRDLGQMGGMWDFCDAQLTADDNPELIDLEQGIPHLKGTPCSLTALSTAEVAELEAKYGATLDLPRGPEGKVLRSDAKPGHFMHDTVTGDGVEFDAIELSLYGRNTV